MKSPEQPSEKSWLFVGELQKPLHTKISWAGKEKKQDEACFKEGVTIDFRFPDTEKLLETACNDFKTFLKAANIPNNGAFKIIMEKQPTETFESFKVEVTADSCRILANDTEGIRRALVFVEDEILRAGGPFLPIRTFERKPLIKTRISRCFFGPIKRPPKNRDELMDDADYYPNEYLNRLAHEGVNGLWLTIHFMDLCPSEIFPEHGKDSEKRLAKLRDTVERCRRYGIKIYIFTIEPMGFGNIPEYLLPMEHLKKHPELKGHDFEDSSFAYFCTSSEKGRKYIEDCVYHIFSKVPNLGGLMDITMGERPTNCYSSIWGRNIWENNCPRCSKREPWEVFSELFSTIARGMRRANPDAEFIAWLYVPYMDDVGHSIDDKKEILRQIAAHTPKGVILQCNFESNGTTEQLGKERIALDYWLSWPGPSDIFKDCARNAVKAGAGISAKIQVGCSHEVATAPFLPVPGNLHKKYKAMHELGVSAVMQCWYFGNYPGLMNKAAGELSFAPFRNNEEDFLLDLAEPIWGGNAAKAVKAWKYFQEGYSNFPVNLSFTWFGPAHNCVVWPLYLKPADKPISPSWKFTFPNKSGDRIGECICYSHTFDEVLMLLEKMSSLWDKGVKILAGLASEYADNRERILDIGLAKALGIQFASAYNVFKFYDLREKLPFMGQAEQLAALNRMKSIVRDEIKNDVELKVLCLEDSRLGFHSEAEGYKYFPAELEWRAGLLEKLLAEDFVEIEAKIKKGARLFPEYTGVSPEGARYVCPSDQREAKWEKFRESSTQWRAWHDKENIYFEMQAPDAHNDKEFAAEIRMEPRRLWPAWHFHVLPDGKTFLNSYQVRHDNRWKAAKSSSENGMHVAYSIPFDYFDGFRNESGAMRINLICGKDSWIKLHPWESRLRFGADNPADLAWLVF